METENDIQLIQRILSGDEAAFGILVDKYQKSVHALAWRKVGDFHDAEEITQDTFLQVYKKLPTLKDPYKFAGWLYVIANRLCIDRIRKKNLAIQSLEDTPVEDIEKSSYTHHVSEQSEIAISEHRREIVKKLLAKLPESERTVMTLHYLGEMTVKEISKFLGVSVSAIHNRLYRARKRLQAKEESLVREVLSSVQISTSIRQNIMRRVADIKLTPSPPPKPLLPWAAFSTAVVLVALLLGVSNQHLVRFQRPYSFEAASEPTIEIIEAPIVLDTVIKPDVRNQIGRTVASETRGAGLQVSEQDSTLNAAADSLSVSETQWMPDPALRAAVREKLGMPAALPLTQAYLQQHLISLDARRKEIADLTGLEHATDLEVLVLIENKIHDISPLSGLRELSFLDLGGNQISDLRPLAALTRLETLQIWHNQIEDISALAGLANLKKLLIENNDIKDFSPLDALSHLAVVNIKGNFRVADYISRVAVAPRIKERDYPSIFAAWSEHYILNLPNLSHDEAVVYHDLSWSGPEFHLQWHRTPEGLRLFGRIDDAHSKSEYLLSQNPNLIRLVSLDYTDTDPADYPEDWPYWIRDENGNRVRAYGGDSDLMIDFTHPVVQDILVQKAVAVAQCGLYDGIFLGGWQEGRGTLNNSGVYYRSVEAEWAARISMVRRMREGVGDDFLIIVETHQRPAPLSAPYVNGMFMEAILDEQDKGYTYDGLREIESTLLWAEQHFREPQVNALEGRGISLEPADTPRNQRMMRIITTLNLTHSDGYVCYDLGIRGIIHEHEYEIWPGHERQHIAGKSHHHNHQHYWYDFWDAPLGRPVGEKAQLYHNKRKGHRVEGLFIREFTNGWAVYNRSGKAQDIQLPMQATGVESGITGIQHTLSDLDGEIYLK